jgi:hypothetical protein
MINFILNASILILAIFLATYTIYCIGLSLVFRRLGKRAWPAFIPLFNYKKLIDHLGLPSRWFGYCLIPYAGGIYSIAVADRLGKVFNKNFVFSSFWLTFGSTLGMFVIARSKKELNIKVINEPPPSLNELKRKLMRKKKHNSI